MRLYGELRNFAGIVLLAAAGASSGQLWALAKDIPKHGPAVVLFDGKDLNHLTRSLPARG